MFGIFPAVMKCKYGQNAPFLSRDSTTKPTGSVSVQKQQMLSLVLHVEKKNKERSLGSKFTGGLKELTQPDKIKRITV